MIEHGPGNSPTALTIPLRVGRPCSSFRPKDFPSLLQWNKFNTGITLAGAGVSQWNDISGNGFHPAQNTDTNRPSHSNGIITFDGVDNFLSVTYGALKAQPLTVYMRARQIAWANLENLDDSDNTQGGIECSILQGGTTPQVQLYADGGAACTNGDWPVDANFYSVCCVYNGASSSIRVGANTKTTGNPGVDGRGGTKLGSNTIGSVFTSWALKEYIVYQAAHTDLQQSIVIGYLNRIP